MIERTTITLGDPARRQSKAEALRRRLSDSLRDKTLAYEQALIRIANGADNPVEIATKVLMGAKE